MKLSAAIIYNELKNEYKTEIIGPRTDELLLSRLEFYMEDNDNFLSDCLYLATVDHLPKRADIQKNSVLVCIGENLNLRYYRTRICLIIIKERADFFKVFMKLQEIFEKYNNWEKQIYKVLLASCYLSNILEDSYPIFQKPMYVLDASFRVVASKSGLKDEDWAVTESGLLNSNSISKYLSVSDMMTEKKNAFILNVLDKKIMCVNLFDHNNQYRGCVAMQLPQSESFTECDEKLIEILAEYLCIAIEKNPVIINEGEITLKKIFQNIIEELPLSYSQQILLTSTNLRSAYRCIYFRCRGKRKSLPLSYICNIFEDTFANSAAFVYDEGIVSFVDVSSLQNEKGSDYKVVLNQKLTSFADQTNVYAGISNEFSDFFNVRMHYLQAQSAIDNGLLLGKEGKLFYYSSYALIEMIINSLGGMPIETYFLPGFSNILDHDKESGVSYLETLKTFLEEGMSYTATSQKLYIHRSTLIDRINRIEKELQADLKDPDVRLQLEILIKAMELEKILTEK